jgi:hypothetical protein
MSLNYAEKKQNVPHYQTEAQQITGAPCELSYFTISRQYI